jgi:hypothetical protein
VWLNFKNSLGKMFDKDGTKAKTPEEDSVLGENGQNDQF